MLTFSSVENVVVIIAASVPAVRSLFMSRVPKKSSYEMHSDYHRNGSKLYGNGNHFGVRSHTSKVYPAPESSEENILPVQGTRDIAKSTSYTVSYEITPDSKG